MSAPWVETTSLAALRAEQLAQPGVVFRHDRWQYRTTAQHLAQGGMGTAYVLERRTDGDDQVEVVVGKTFHATYLYQLQTDEVTRRDHQTNLAAIARVAAIEHPGILPTYVAQPIADNFLFVTPRMGSTLLEAISRHRLTPRARTKLLIQALEGLARLHEARIAHRDFTLRNVLLDDHATSAYVFDFDLAVSLDDIAGATYRDYYRGRIFGSPGYSVPPETVDPGLLDSPVSLALDVYAVGGALHALFTDQLPYGPTDDMWGLLVRIAEGVVAGGRSLVHYPETVPMVLRPIIEGCLERDPTARYARVTAIIQSLRSALPELDDRQTDAATFASTTQRIAPVDPLQRLEAVHSTRLDQRVTKESILLAERAVRPWGYQVQQSLGRVKGHHIYVAAPRPDLLASGQFPDANTFPKLVTVIDLHAVSDPRTRVENWQARFLPTLKKARRGLLTTLHNVIYDADTGSLLLFSEFIDDPRFGNQLDAFDLHVDGALALGFLVVRQVAALHEDGVAHNNVHPGALLFKGLHDSYAVQPAMIGLVEPSLAADALTADVRALAAMLLSWLRPERVAMMGARARPDLDALRGQLATWAYDGSAAPRIDQLVAATSDGLAVVDFNFSVLRDSGGDLEEYALLLVSHRFYHLLWGARR